MLEVNFLDNGILRVKETICSCSENKVSFWHYDLEKRLRSVLGKDGEIPSMPMTEREYLWAIEIYVPLAEKQKAARDAQIAMDPDRFEKARRWDVMVTASMISDGSYDTLTREEIKVERVVRYEALKATSRKPTDGELALAHRTISERDMDSLSDERISGEDVNSCSRERAAA